MRNPPLVTEVVRGVEVPEGGNAKALEIDLVPGDRMALSVSDEEGKPIDKVVLRARQVAQRREPHVATAVASPGPEGYKDRIHRDRVGGLLVDRLETIPIVLVEGSREAARAFKGCLAGSPFTVWTDTAYSDHLLTLHRTLSPQVVVVDLGARPQVESGFDALKAIVLLLKESPSAKVVVTSDADSRWRAEAAIAAGAVGHIARPYTADNVVGGLCAALGIAEPTTPRRRVAVRVPARVDFFYRDPGNPMRLVRTDDLSESGARARVHRPFAAGEEVRVAVKIPEAPRAMWIQARVAHCAPSEDARYQLGVEFVGIAEEQRDALRGFVRERCAPGLS